MASSTRGVPGPLVFRPRTGFVVCGLWLALSLLWLVLETRSGVAGMLRLLPLVLFLDVVVFALFGRPCVIVGPDGVQLRNVLRDVWMPYSALTAIAIRYNLRLTDREGTEYQAWAAPAASRFTSSRITEWDLETRPPSLRSDAPQLGPDPARGRDAAAAAAAVQEAWVRSLTRPGGDVGAAPPRPDGPRSSRRATLPADPAPAVEPAPAAGATLRAARVGWAFPVVGAMALLAVLTVVAFVFF